MKNLMTENRKRVFPLMSLLTVGLLLSCLRPASYATFAVWSALALSVIFFILRPSVLFPVKHLIDLIIKGLSFLFTVILIFLLQCIVLFIIKLFLKIFRVNLFDMRFRTGEPSYYKESDNGWKGHLDDPF